MVIIPGEDDDFTSFELNCRSVLRLREQAPLGDVVIEHDVLRMLEQAT